MESAPAALADAQGRALFGRYAGAVADVSTARWDGDRGLFSPRRLQRKTWLYLGAFTERAMAGFAIADAGLVSTAFVYVFDRDQRRMIEHKITVPFGMAADFAGKLSARWALSSGGKRFLITPNDRGWRAEFAGPDMQLTLEFESPRRGMTTIAPAPGRPFNSTYKDCALTAGVDLRMGGESMTAQGHGMADFTLGYPPRRTFWNWAALAGTTDDGRAVGLNLVAHFNNGLENGLWIGERIVPLAQATFFYDPAKLNDPWRVTTADGVIDLRFVPEGRRAENLNALVLGSRFVQLFGRYEGHVMLDGAKIPLAANGVTEEHWALW